MVDMEPTYRLRFVHLTQTSYPLSISSEVLSQKGISVVREERIWSNLVRVIAINFFFDAQNTWNALWLRSSKTDARSFHLRYVLELENRIYVQNGPFFQTFATIPLSIPVTLHRSPRRIFHSAAEWVISGSKIFFVCLCKRPWFGFCR